MGILLQLNNIRKRYGQLAIFEDTSASFGDDQKIGIIGRNGAGKSTLCKLILGQEELDGGDISKSPSLRLSYLEQHDVFRTDETVIEFLMHYTGREEWECGKLAGRFQLKNDLLNTEIGRLSGGFQTRVKLVAMLLQQPNFLILDEPSNYLDLKTLILFENLLRDFNGGFLIVSHDREFLKRTCGHTLEIEHGRMTLYPGDIEQYLEFKEQQTELAEKYNANIEAEQKRIQKFIDRFRAKATKAAQVQSRIKQLERMEKIEIDHPIRTMRIRLPEVEEKKGTALSCSGLTVGYPNHVVAENIYFDTDRSKHIAVLGDNGQGKTTFLRTLAGDLEKKAGAIKWGYGLRPAYYAQHVYAALNPDDTAGEYLRRAAASDVIKQEILDMAGSFLFGGDEIEKKIEVLSGGERARLCLVGLLLSKNPVLLLDEPTNHLDFESVEALGYALQEYNGTIFFTSHDRTFVSLVATGILEVKDGAITHYPDSYESYVYYLETLCQDEVDQQQKQEPAKKQKSSYQIEKERQSRLRKLNTQAKKLEEQIEICEQEKSVILQYFLDHPTEYSQEKTDRLNELNSLLQDHEITWLQLHEDLETLDRNSGH